MYSSKLSVILDKFAISLSALCVVHCLMTPILLTTIPALTALGIADEKFHQYLIFAVIPLSVIAAFMGCRKHKKYVVALPILVGLLTLVITAVVGGEVLGEGLERLLTVIGTIIIAYGHIRNFRLCQQQDCHC